LRRKGHWDPQSKSTNLLFFSHNTKDGKPDFDPAYTDGMIIPAANFLPAFALRSLDANGERLI